MALVQKPKHITGALIVDGTIEAEQIKTDSLTANKFKGATEEQYFNFFSGQTASFNTYTTLHEFDFPQTELGLHKTRSIEVDIDGTLYTGTTSIVGSTVYAYIEVQVPDEITYRYIGEATHESYPESGWQRVYVQGNVLNRFGLGQAGSIGTYRSFRNLKFIQYYVLTNTQAVSNGTFTSNTNGWTAVSGTVNSQYGQIGQIVQDTTSEKAHIYQEVSTTSGKYYEFGKTSYGSSNSNVKFYLSTSTDVADAFFTKTHITSTTTTDNDIVQINHDTVYVIIENQGSAEYDFVWVDNITLSETEPRTYVDLATNPQAIYNTASLYYHPYGSSSANTWKVVKTKQLSIRTVAYTHYLNLNAKAELGVDDRFLKCRVRFRHLFSGDTINITSGTIHMKSRMTGEQNE